MNEKDNKIEKISMKGIDTFNQELNGIKQKNQTQV